MDYFEKPYSPEELVHFGVKGMKWGIRKNQESSSQTNSGNSQKSSRLTDRQKKVLKGTAIIAGTLVLTAGTVYAKPTLSQNGKGSFKKVSQNAKTMKKGAEATRKVLQEPTDLIYGTRAKYHGFTLLKKGDTPDVLSIFEKGLGRDRLDVDNFFEKFDGGKIAASFLDLQGRKDFAGRVIPHMIIIPADKAQGINSIDDVKTKIWPTLEKTYQAFYDQYEKPSYV